LRHGRPPERGRRSMAGRDRRTVAAYLQSRVPIIKGRIVAETRILAGRANN
jgi:hypothetical protein